MQCRGLSARPPAPPSDRHPNNRAPHGTASPNPRRSRRVRPHQRELLTAELPLFMQAGWLSARPPAPPSDRHPNNRAPHGTASPNPRRSRRVRPRQGELLTAKLSFIDASRGLSARPLHPFGESAYPQGGSMCLRAHQRAFLGEKQSARPALPYTPLVASLISRF